MSRRGLILSSVIGLTVIFTIVVFVAIKFVDSIQFSPPSPAFSTDFAYDKNTFLASVSEITMDSPGDVPRVIILPHHLTASPLIAQGISLLSSKPPATIIILSPNHADSGQCPIVTSYRGWDTPSGRITVNKEILKGFNKSGLVCVDDDSLSIEHGLAGLLPFVKYYLPDTKIVPFILKKDIDPLLINNFTQYLTTLSNKIVLLASVDFSHGLSQPEAIKRDAVTGQFIRAFNYPELLRLSSEYVDSPVSLVIALKHLESLGAQPSFLAHTDSSLFNHSTTEVTSYFLITSGRNTLESSDSSSFTLVFGGDVMLGRTVNTRIKKYSDNSWPFRKVYPLLSSGDITMVNLESPFRSGCRPTDGGMIFCADPLSVEGLILSGVDVVTLANNHIGNQKEEGIKETLSVLSSAGISSIGQGTPYIKKINNTSIAFLGFNDIPPYISEISNVSPEIIKNEISRAKKNADLVIATFHWGNEYSLRSSRQVELAHLAIDSGADVVIGHHPHWVQETETYRGKPIYYSLGNLVFDQMWSEETKNGLIVKLTFSNSTLIEKEEFPIHIYDYGQPALE